MTYILPLVSDIRTYSQHLCGTGVPFVARGTPRVAVVLAQHKQERSVLYVANHRRSGDDLCHCTTTERCGFATYPGVPEMMNFPRANSAIRAAMRKALSIS